MSDDTQVRAVVHGRVQGVYFRGSTVEQAQALNLAGYTRNLPDGSVEVVARGPKDKVERLIAFLHRGPSTAQVERVDQDWKDTSEAPRPFGIRY